MIGRPPTERRNLMTVVLGGDETKFWCHPKSKTETEQTLEIIKKPNIS